MAKYKCTPVDFARLLFEEIIHTGIKDSFITNVIQNDNYTPSEKATIESLGQERIHQESSYCWMFLCTFVIHREVSDLDSELARRIHQSVRQMIDTEILHSVAASDTFTRRIGLYARAIESDLEVIGADDVIHFLNLITSFYENLLGRSVHRGEFQLARLLFSLFVSETLCNLQDIVKKVRTDVVLIDD